MLVFFIAGLLYLLRFERVDNLGAYRIPPETGLLIPSGCIKHQGSPSGIREASRPCWDWQRRRVLQPALRFRCRGRGNGSSFGIWVGNTGKDRVKLFMALQFKLRLIVFAFVTLGWTSSCLGQTPQQTPLPGPEQLVRNKRGTASAGAQQPGPALPGTISGTVVDPSGAVVDGARVRLTGEDQSLNEEVLSGKDGQFSFSNIAPGPFPAHNYGSGLRHANLLWNSASGGDPHCPADRVGCC